jgi:tetratricopeptide (TPR) repeat protein
MTHSHKIFALTLLTGLLSANSALAISDRYRDLSARLTTNAEQVLLQGKAQAADDMLNLALTADPGNAQAYVLKGQAQGKLDNKEEALRLIGVGLEIEPSDQAAIKLQGEAALAVGDVEQAEKSLSRLRIICKAPCEAANDLADQLANAGEPENAAKED